MKALRILIADDEALTRLGLRTMLQDLGHQVVGAAPDGIAALQMARETRPDLVILDIKMPGLDGLAAAEAIAAERPVPILILSAYSDRDLVERAATLAVQGYLVKPVQESSLAAEIELARSGFRQWQVLRQEAADLREAMHTRDLIAQAKARLMEQEGLSEQEAFARIQRRSRRQRRPLRAVAEEILNRS